jgi:hypothetical protein
VKELVIRIFANTYAILIIAIDEEINSMMKIFEAD